MSAVTRHTAVGIFAESEQAKSAIQELRQAGFGEDQIGLLTRPGVTVIDHDQKAPEGLAIGAATGAGVATLWAVGVATIGLPAIGPAIAGGILASLLASAASGAAVGGLLGLLIGFGIPEDEARYYENEFLAGRTVVTVKADARYGDAVAILRRHGGYDIDSAAEFAGKIGASLP